jgi:hypothetical protein
MKRPAPLLLIDVDGVISLFGFGQTAPPRGSYVSVDGLPHLISATAGGLLSRLAEAFECVWCTGWEDRADEHLPHLLGTPSGWPHLRLGATDGHWKLGAIDLYAGPERPAAWIDDAHDERTEAWAQRRPGPTLLVRTDPAVGLTEQHVERLLSWSASV